MDDDLDLQWAQVTTSYRRSQRLHDCIVAGREMLLVMGPPPVPPPRKVSRGALEWFEELLETPSLDDLDDLLEPGTGGQHGKRRQLLSGTSRK